RRMAGIPCKQRHVSNMAGYVIPAGSLPHPGFGHVFVCANAPVLAYDISKTETRVMFDVPMRSDGPCLESLPLTLSTQVEAAMQTQQPLRAANDSIVPEVVISGRLVCVGDAGGCCHPLTATGLTACTRDAMLLRQALAETDGSIFRALKRYARMR